MPFVQRVVSPTFLSRSNYGGRLVGASRSVGVRASSSLGATTIGGGGGGVTTSKVRVTGTGTTKADETSVEESDSVSVITTSIGIHCSTSTRRNIKVEDPHCSKESDVIGFVGGITTTSDSVDEKSHRAAASQQLHQHQYHHHHPQASSGNNKKSIDGGRSSICLNNNNNNTKSNNNNNNSTNISSALVNGHELESVINITLSNALRQLASLVIIANDIFLELNEELQQIGDRSKHIKDRINVLEHKLDDFDPKLVAVPEGDLGAFAQRKNHFSSKKPVDQQLFTVETRTRNLKALYEAAAKAPLHTWEEDYKTVNDKELCDLPFKDKTKELKSKIDAEIETRLPAAVEELRKWTSTEALGDITVTPDCISRVGCINCTNHHHSIVCNNKSFPSTSIVVAGTVDDDDVVDHQNCSALICGHNVQQATTIINDDQPIDHRLPSPEEQCLLIAKKFPAEVISVDISGRRFERMCLARKSMTACNSAVDHDNSPENDEQSTIKRRSRSRKPRGKRRNTIAGTDQKEIEEVAGGNNVLTKSSNDLSDNECKVARSKSNDIVRNFSTMSSSAIDVGKATLTRFNSLRLWGRHRLKFINRNNNDKQKVSDNNDPNEMAGIDSTTNSSNKIKRKHSDKEKKSSASAAAASAVAASQSHERKSSYSSSEKSLMLNSQNTIKLSEAQSASINPVKLRESSSLRRQRRNVDGGGGGSVGGICHKDEPHSSSGNWSASSESGRASIGSEITIQPKSSASSTSLNHSNVHPPSSGPPSSIISRRRFLNTSASSSVTSEGTATPDLQQINDICYDDETSSAYSCDTEGYYTSFHVDSGLKTLKEEDPITPVQSTSALSSTNSFENSSNQTFLTAESEYELFGRGSTSTTTSSAGTVCTTLMAGESDRSLMKAPDAPERKSSLAKLSRSSSNASNSTLERSYSSSTVGSTLERCGTIKRNGVLLRKEVSAVVHETRDKESVNDNNNHRIDSPDSRSIDNINFLMTTESTNRNIYYPSNSELEYSESSDLEGVDRIERIKQKTTIDSSRIPSMCIITPTTSDDENTKDIVVVVRERQPMALPIDIVDNEIDSNLYSNTEHKIIPSKHQQQIGFSKIVIPDKKAVIPNIGNHKKSTLHPLNNMLGKLKGVLPNIKKLPDKEHPPIESASDDNLYDSIGEYVTIADVTNNNNAIKPSTGVYYSNDLVRRNLAAVLSGNLNQETEYVSLNELPCNLRREDKGEILGSGSSNKDAGHFEGEKINNRSMAATAATAANMFKDDNDCSGDGGSSSNNTAKEERELYKGARVTFDAHGKIIYNSDSLKRRKASHGHSTFIPGPHVKESECESVSFPSPPPPLPLSSTIKYYSFESATNDLNCESNNRVQSPPQLAYSENKKVSNLTDFTNNFSTFEGRGRNNDNKMQSNDDIDTDNVEKGYQHLSHNKNSIKIPEDVKTMQNVLQHQQPQNNQIFWTLQNKRRPRTKATINDDVSALIDDDYDKYYTTPSKNWPNASHTSQSEMNISESCNVSPITSSRTIPSSSSSTGGFKTSTPVRRYSHGSTTSSDDNSVSSPKLTFGRQHCNTRLNYGTDLLQDSKTTCSDRLGTSKISLMDFKKLLLSKSSKTTPSTTKVSAVEMLKLNKNTSNQQQQQQQVKKPPSSSSSSSSLNTSMSILELNGSPKTFANRRMLKQGIFGSPSKSIMMKQRGGAWRMNASRTDVISTSIPEVNSEEDNSSSNSSSNSTASSETTPTTSTMTTTPSVVMATRSENLVPEEKCVIEETVDLKNNMFLQVEKNNFMRGEVQFNSAIKSHLHRNNLEKSRAQFFTNRDSSGKDRNESAISSSIEQTHSTEITTETGTTTDNNMDNKIIIEGIKNIPALETAL